MCDVLRSKFIIFSMGDFRIMGDCVVMRHVWTIGNCGLIGGMQGDRSLLGQWGK